MNLASTTFVYMQHGANLPEGEAARISKANYGQIPFRQPLQLLRNNTHSLFALCRIVRRIFGGVLAERFGIRSFTLRLTQSQGQPFPSGMPSDHIQHFASNPKLCVASQGSPKFGFEGMGGFQEADIASLNEVRHLNTAALRQAGVQPTCQRADQGIQLIYHLGRQEHATGRCDTVQTGRRTTHHSFRHVLRIEWRARLFFSRFSGFNFRRGLAPRPECGISAMPARKSVPSQFALQIAHPRSKTPTQHHSSCWRCETGNCGRGQQLGR